MAKEQLGLGLVEKPELVTHQISKYLHELRQGILGEGETWSSKLTSERAVQLLPLVTKLGNRNGWNKQGNDPDSSRRVICCNCRPEEYVTALKHTRWMEVCREHMVQMMNESNFTELKLEKQAWPMTVKHAVQSVEKLEEWLYRNKEWMK
tara:strand:- start:33 stop:482 length:450 start_codon:yes stop_codon:yes gene_type:complete